MSEGEMPQVMLFMRVIKGHIVAEWKRVLRDAERACTQQDPCSDRAFSDVTKSAQLTLLKELVALKGSRLSPHELEYTLDLFHTLCATSSNVFSPMKDATLYPTVRREVRALAATEYLAAS